MKSIRDDHGSATVLGLAICALVLLSFTSIAVGFSISYEFRKVQNAVDLSALAAAAKSISDPEYTCKVAKDIAELNDAVFGDCEVLNELVKIHVRSSRFGWIQATAKAGIF